MDHRIWPGKRKDHKLRKCLTIQKRLNGIIVIASKRRGKGGKATAFSRSIQEKNLSAGRPTGGKKEKRSYFPKGRFPV